jgi:hypothetical protein
LSIFSPSPFFGRCVTSPRAVSRLPWALAPRASNDLPPYTTNFLSSPAPGRWPQWDHQQGSASRRLDGAVAGLRARLACSRFDLAGLNDALFSMSWHTSRVPCLASPLTYGFVLTFLARCVTSPRAVWRLPVALGPIVSNDLLSVRAQTPVTRFSLRLSTRAGRPVGGDPISTTAFLQGPEIPRAASTSTKIEGGLSTAIPLMPL